jgi:hypothetical protein
MAKIYISSTYRDLEAYRRVVSDILRQAGHTVIGMEDYPAIDERPLDKCRKDVADCDIYVGIFAWYYGYIPPHDNPEGKSITELEYRHASVLGKQRLIFLLRGDAPWPPPMMERGEKYASIEALRTELGREHTVKFFENKDDLAAKVTASIAYALSTSQVSTLSKIQTDLFSGVQSYDVPDSRVVVINDAISNIRTAQLVDIDLENGLSWWSTRLYLLAALASDYTQVEQLIFANQGFFTGMASPIDIRRALGRLHPGVEAAYRKSFPEPLPGASPLPQQAFPAPMPQEVDQIVQKFIFTELPNAIQLYYPGFFREDQIKMWVTKEQLQQWLGPQLYTDSVALQPMDIVMLSQIISRPAPFVAITEEGRLVQVVDRKELAVKVTNIYLNETLRSALRRAGT